MVRKKETNRVIFHHSLSQDVSSFTIDMWHKERGFDAIGYHYVVRKDGGIEIGRDIKMVGAHAFGRNSHSIGVCITGNFNKYKPTFEQYQAASYIYLYLCGIYKKKLKIDFHRTGFEPCPGYKFNRSKLKRLIRELSGKKTWFSGMADKIKQFVRS